MYTNYGLYDTNYLYFASTVIDSASMSPLSRAKEVFSLQIRLLFTDF